MDVKKNTIPGGYESSDDNSDADWRWGVVKVREQDVAPEGVEEDEGGIINGTSGSESEKENVVEDSKIGILQAISIEDGKEEEEEEEQQQQQEQQQRDSEEEEEEESFLENELMGQAKLLVHLCNKRTYLRRRRDRLKGLLIQVEAYEGMVHAEEQVAVQNFSNLLDVQRKMQS
jgi:hypothetical protein